jgi:hypothetical protein
MAYRQLPACSIILTEVLGPRCRCHSRPRACPALQLTCTSTTAPSGCKKPLRTGTRPPLARRYLGVEQGEAFNIEGVDTVGRHRFESDEFSGGLRCVAESVPDADDLIIPDDRVLVSMPLLQQARQLAPIGLQIACARSHCSAETWGGRVGSEFIARGNRGLIL